MDIGDQKLSESRESAPDKDNYSSITWAWGSLKNALIGCSAAVLFGLAVLLMSILSVANPQSVFPQEAATASAEKVIVEYYLPYPGVLPDNPLYKIKVLRDWTKYWLAFNSVKKAELDLQFADKRINAAKVLIEGGKVSLGVTTATKAEKYLEKSVNRVAELTRSGQDVKSLLLTLDKSSQKHGELLRGLLPLTSGADSQAIEGTLKLNTVLQEIVAQALRE
ncbi:MAG: DUF5667 domain-containing protein [bacterium]|nr:DUF5667 domain-containing protein [bacterium]